MNEAETIRKNILFKFCSGLNLYLIGMDLSKKLLDEAVKNKNRNEAFIHFYHFLCDMFALRENLSIEDKITKAQKEDSVFGALKNYYECIKHKNRYNKVQDINLLVGNASYPRAYPYCYGESYLKFQKMSLEIVKLKRAKEEERIRMMELHAKYLEDKNVSEVLDFCIKENEKLLKENNNG